MKPKDIFFKRALPLLYGCLLVLIEMKFLHDINDLSALSFFFVLGLLWGMLVYTINKDLMSIAWLTLTSTALPTLILLLSFLIAPKNMIDYSIVCLILSNWLSTNLPCFVLRMFTSKAAGMKFKSYSKFVGITFIISYILLMLSMLFSDYFSVRTGQRMINLVPLKTITLYLTGIDHIHLRTIIINLLGNIILFIPLGFYIKGFIKNIKWTLLTIISTPILIEFTQYLLATGVSDIDDVILNILGQLIGLLILISVDRVYHKINKSSTDSFLGF